ncbi:MAG TPA: hypothetical protein VHG10_15565 [Glycomyces sp.]|nr:hypothetical protein [Glycomyces sp.]
MADRQCAKTHRNRTGRHRTRIAAALALTLAGASAACDMDAVSSRADGTATGVFYALGDDHQLYRWDPEAGGEDDADGTIEPVLDLSGVWDGEGDVGTVMRASLSIDPRQQHAAWVAGGNPDASLKFGDLDTGEITTAVEYPVDHACIDPAWLADGSAILVHRAPVWGNDTTDTANALPMPVESWGAIEWYSPEAGSLPTTVELEPRGCRLRWYTAEDGAAQAIYHDAEVTEFFRIEATGQVLETIRVPGLQGTDPLTIGLVGVDPTGRYACVVDGYAPHGAFKGGFTIRAESGTQVIDLESGEAIGPDETNCTTLHSDGFISKSNASATFTDYQGERQWTVELPGRIAETPVLFFFPNES